MINEKNDEFELDLKKLFWAYLNKWWLILGSTVLALVLAVLFTVNCITPLYSAAVTVYVNNAGRDQKINYITSTNLETAQHLVNTYIQIIESDTVLEKVVDAAHLGMEAEDIRKIMHARQKGETEIFDVIITHPDPVMAAKIANALAEVAPVEIENFVEGSSTKIIDYAKVPEQPSSPSVVKNGFLGAVFGGFLAAAYLTLMFLMDVRIKDEEDLNALFSLPVLGQIPGFGKKKSKPRRSGKRTAYEAASEENMKEKAKKQEGQRIREEQENLLGEKSEFFIREAYKTLRTNVSFTLTGEEESKAIVVTSSLQGEGKSITAVNLAISYAMADRKVLIVDCDMRRPKLARLMKVSSKVGLSDVIMKPDLLKEAICTTEIKGLDVILAGSIPPNPSELLGSARMQRVLEELRKTYDYIFLDSPPVNLVTDAVVLAPESDGVLFLVRANQTERGSVLQAVDQMEYAKTKILGFVLNDVDMEKTWYGRGKGNYKNYFRYGRYGYYGRGTAVQPYEMQQETAQETHK